MCIRLHLFAFVLIVTSASILYADADKVGTYNIGAGAGFVTGYGLSYRQWFNANGLQVTFSPYYNTDDYSTEAIFSVGATGLRMIKEAKYVNLFGYYGAHFWYDYSSYKGGLEAGVPYSYSSSSTERKLLFLGGGPGFDFHFWRISFNLMFGLAFRSDFKGNTGMNFTGETALYYSF
jgi:hypothetical protein